MELNLEKQKNPLWYLEESDDLKDVTSATSNNKLGIINIFAYEPTERQKQGGVLARVTVKTVLGSFQGISIKESKTSPDALRVELPSHKSGTNYINYYTISQVLKAQILRYAHSLMK